MSRDKRPLEKTISYARGIKIVHTRAFTGAKLTSQLAACYASFHMQNRMSRQWRSMVMPWTGRNGSEDVGGTAGCVAALGNSWDTVQLTSRHARALR